jgi:transcription elongation GreA/GreB family factor
MLLINENPILVISFFSPIGDAALGLMAGENFEVETPKEIRKYEVLEVF